MLGNFKSIFREIYFYNTRYSRKYANKIRMLISKSISRLADFPYIGRYLPEDDTKKYGELICQKYRILYSVSEKNDTVYIHYIIYAGRNFGAFFQDL